MLYPPAGLTIILRWIVYCLVILFALLGISLAILKFLEHIIDDYIFDV